MGRVGDGSAADGAGRGTVLEVDVAPGLQREAIEGPLGLGIEVEMVSHRLLSFTARTRTA
jgi:hypothetical protein